MYEYVLMDAGQTTKSKHVYVKCNVIHICM